MKKIQLCELGYGYRRLITFLNCFVLLLFLTILEWSMCLTSHIGNMYTWRWSMYFEICKLVWGILQQKIELYDEVFTTLLYQFRVWLIIILIKEILLRASWGLRYWYEWPGGIVKGDEWMWMYNVIVVFLIMYICILRIKNNYILFIYCLL